MDLTPLLSEAAKLGFVVLLLLAAVIGLVKWVRGLLDRSDAKATEDRKECLAREKALAERLSKVEDRQYSDHTDMMQRCANALELHARALDRLTDHDTGLHLALVQGKGRGD